MKETDDRPAFVSTFSGIGGLDLGLERAGWRCVAQCESDEWRRSVLRERFPDVPCYTDVREVAKGAPSGGLRTLGGNGDGADAGRGRAWPENGDAGSVGALCGGFPCQDVSVAGQRAGLAGDRSGLFHEFARVAESLRPRWLLVENVPGLLSSNGGRDFGVVLGTLAELGYGLAWRIVDSRFFGVPQRRRRVFVVGALADGDPAGAAERAGQVLAVGTRCPRHPAQGATPGPNVAGTLGARTSGGGRTDDLDGHGAYVPHYYVEDFEDGTLTSSTGRIDRHPLLANATPTKDRQDASVETHIANGQGVRRLTPTECERLQAFPDGWTDLGPDSRRYAALGDAVTVNVAHWIGRRLLEAHRQ